MNTFVLTWGMLLPVTDLTVNFTREIKNKNLITTSMTGAYFHYVNLGTPWPQFKGRLILGTYCDIS